MIYGERDSQTGKLDIRENEAKWKNVSIILQYSKKLFHYFVSNYSKLETKEL